MKMLFAVPLMFGLSIPAFAKTHSFIYPCLVPNCGPPSKIL